MLWSLIPADTTIIQVKEIARLEEPSLHDLNNLREWMIRPRMGNLGLVGQDKKVWEEPTIEPGQPRDLLAIKIRSQSRELLAIKVRKHEDFFSRWISDTVVWWVHYTLRLHDVVSRQLYYAFEILISMSHIDSDIVQRCSGEVKLFRGR